jgi:hypothetical protein
MDIDDLIQSTKKFLETEIDIPGDQRKIVNDFTEQCHLRRSNLGFIKRYLRNELGFHMHLTIRRHFEASQMEGGGRTDLCAIVEHRVGNRVGELGVIDCEGFASINPGNGGIQATMFVDVRELNQESQKAMPVILSVVRLQSLDVCIGAVGNPVRNLGEMLPIDRQDRMVRHFCEQRELTGPGQSFRPWTNQIPFDEFEKKVIEGGPEMVKAFACQDGDLDRWRLVDSQLFVSIRFGDNFERVIASIFGYALLEGFIVVHDPDDFGPSGFERSRHDSKENAKNADGIRDSNPPA